MTVEDSGLRLTMSLDGRTLVWHVTNNASTAICVTWYLKQFDGSLVDAFDAEVDDAGVITYDKEQIDERGERARFVGVAAGKSKEGRYPIERVALLKDMETRAPATRIRLRNGWRHGAMTLRRDGLYDVDCDATEPEHTIVTPVLSWPGT